MNRAWIPAAILIGLAGSVQSAGAFTLNFDWGKIPLCTSGHPNRVSNPIFSLGDVPAGTARIRFKLTDRNVPTFDHGGGTVAFSGKSGQVAPGAFIYNSPCPPSGSHTYMWTATALDAAGKALATATASQKYP